MEAQNVAAWIADAAKPRRAKRRIVLPPIGASVAFEASLATIALRVLREAQRHSQRTILQELRSARTVLTTDAVGWFFRPLSWLKELLVIIIDEAATEFIASYRRETARHGKKLNEALKSAMGVDLGAALREEGIDELMLLAVRRHIALIKGVGDDLAKRLESSLIDKLVAGASVREIAEVLTKEFGFARRRATLIARDQAGKWNSELNRVRQGRAGVKEYIWTTAGDERVRGNPEGKYPTARPSHWARHGKTFRWSDPPEGGHPGYAINCRCVPRAVVTF